MQSYHVLPHLIGWIQLIYDDSTCSACSVTPHLHDAAHQARATSQGSATALTTSCILASSSSSSSRPRARTTLISYFPSSSYRGFTLANTTTERKYIYQFKERERSINRKPALYVHML